jgi:hypothetical protein
LRRFFTESLFFKLAHFNHDALYLSPAMNLPQLSPAAIIKVVLPGA